MNSLQAFIVETQREEAEVLDRLRRAGLIGPETLRAADVPEARAESCLIFLRNDGAKPNPDQGELLF